MEQGAAPYFLSRQAHVCVTGDAMVILDQATGKYLSLDRCDAASLGDLVLDWPLPPDGQRRPKLLQSLLDRQLITRNPLQGKSAASPRIALPREWVREGEPRGCPQITARYVRRFIASVAYAACSRAFVPSTLRCHRPAGARTPLAAGQQASTRSPSWSVCSIGFDPWPSGRPMSAFSTAWQCGSSCRSTGSFPTGCSRSGPSHSQRTAGCSTAITC